MKVEGNRIRRVRLIQGERYIVAVDVEMVIPADDSSEPCYESETLTLLRSIEDQVKIGDVDFRKKHGRVYEAVDAS